MNNVSIVENSISHNELLTNSDFKDSNTSVTDWVR